MQHLDKQLGFFLGGGFCVQAVKAVKYFQSLGSGVCPPWKQKIELDLFSVTDLEKHRNFYFLMDYLFKYFGLLYNILKHGVPCKDRYA